MNTIQQTLHHTYQTYPNIPKFWVKDWLLFVLNQPHAFLIAQNDYVLSCEEYARYNAGITKLADGMPLAYLTGVQAFYGRDFMVNAHTLTPRPDTELIVDMALDVIKKTNKAHLDVLELGTGSGCIAISLAKQARAPLNITATDFSAQALAVAKHNATHHKAKIHFVLSDWFNDIDGQFDVIVSNPPYIKAQDEHLVQLAHEPISALVAGDDGLSDIQIIIKQSLLHLHTGGFLLLEHGYDQKQAVQQLLMQNGYQNISTHKDFGNQDRVTLGQKAP